MLLDYLIISLTINTALFIPAYIFKTDKLTDLSYGLSFIAVAAFAFMTSTQAMVHALILGMVLVWAIRLIGYLLIRIHKMQRDKRFDGVRENIFRFARFWLFQAIVVWLVLFPVFLVSGVSDPQLSALSLVGVSIWLLGLVIETIADIQKYRFKQDAKNNGKWIASGVWKFSRHPNYLGEILCWIGVYVYASATLSSLGLILAFISPVTISLILLFVSGIPLLEKRAESKWGSDDRYKQYKKETAVLIPYIY